MSPSLSQPKPQPTLFIVDDDRGLSRLMARTLQREGFLTATAESFQTAVAWLETRQPDLMLLDLKLEDSGGQDLIDHLNGKGRSVPFLVITGQGDERVAVAMMKRGAIDYLVKDVDFLRFLPEVARRALKQLDRERKLAAAEEALRRSEANLAKAQQIAHLGSYEIHVPSSVEDYRSDEIYRILGVDPGQEKSCRQDAIERMVHPDDRERYRQVLNRAIGQAAAFDFEYRVVRPDGSVRYVQSVGEPVLERDGRVSKLMGTLLDITQRRRAESRQKVQFAATSALAEASTLSEAAPKILQTICETLDWQIGELWEAESSDGDLKCVETWPPVSNTVGEMEPGTQQMRSTLQSALPRRAWQMGQPLWIEDLAQDRGTAGSDLPRNGIGSAVAFPALLGTEVLAMLVFFTSNPRQTDPDLLQTFSVLGSQMGQFIERKRAEEALRREHAFTSAVLDTSAALVVVLDRRGRIIRFNRACEQTTGYSASEVNDKPLWELFLIPEELEPVKRVFQELCSGQFPNRNENYWLTRQGEKRLVAWSNSALLDEHRAVEYVISIGIDVTERRRLEQEILQISEIEQRRIGQDLHDGLCQHLAATELMSQILEQKLARKSRSDSARAAEISRQVREAISQTRLLARGLSPVVLESEGLMSALHELADNTERMFRVGCQFECETPVLIHDHSTATHLYRIAQEAVSNSIRHGKAKRIVIRFKRTGGRTTLEVQDNGTGLPIDLAKAKGMGLRIMQYRAAMIGGALTVQSGPGGGTVVACSIQDRLEETRTS